MTIVLADIGGTHARFALAGQDGAIEKAEKLAVADFTTLEEALVAYGAAYNCDKSDLYIATAAWPHPDGSWRFARPGRWTISPEELEKTGWNISYIGNDFGAGARGALVLDESGLFNVQKAGANDIAQDRYAVLGSGTGLGLAYVKDGLVHETYGGHMEIPQRTDEQHTIVKLVTRLKDDDRPVIAEDVISGPGIALLYRAACMLHGQPYDMQTGPEEILAQKDSVLCAHALKLYHEFLGLFAHQAVIYGHAYAGLYMDGGVLHRLVEHSIFDTERFLRFFVGEPLPLIKKQMQAMAANIVTDPFVTLRGLMEIMRDDS